MPKYVKFIKDLLTKKKRIMDNEPIEWRQVAVQSFRNPFQRNLEILIVSQIL